MVSVNSDVVIVSAGLKSEAVIPADQFYDEKGEIEVAVGDEVEVALDAVEDGFGETRLSREKAKRAQTWIGSRRPSKRPRVVHGMINGRVKGGFTVEIDTVRAFLPGSLVDVRPVRDPGYLEGKQLEFKVIKLDQKRNNVVVFATRGRRGRYSASAKRCSRRCRKARRARASSRTSPTTAHSSISAVLTVCCTSPTWHGSASSIRRVVNVGDEDRGASSQVRSRAHRVSPRHQAAGRRSVVRSWRGVIRRSTRCSARLPTSPTTVALSEIEEGVEGLVHVSEMDWTNKNVNPSEVVQVGDEVEVMVLDIDEERRRISLGMKQCQSNPWAEFAATLKRRSRSPVRSSRSPTFGIFIGLDGGIDGLVHLSDISWESKAKRPCTTTTRARSSRLLFSQSIRSANEFLSASSSWTAIRSTNGWRRHPKGTMVTGKITEVEPRGATVDLGNGVIGNLRASELQRTRVEDARTVLKVGDEVEAKFMAVDRKSRSIALSIKAKEAHEEAEVVQNYKSEGAGATSGTTLGELLKDQISSGD